LVPKFLNNKELNNLKNWRKIFKIKKEIVIYEFSQTFIFRSLFWLKKASSKPKSKIWKEYATFFQNGVLEIQRTRTRAPNIFSILYCHLIDTSLFASGPVLAQKITLPDDFQPVPGAVTSTCISVSLLRIKTAYIPFPCTKQTTQQTKKN
jgi:hypothetical protein